MKALIVSYFGPRDSENVRVLRKKYHSIQIDWLIEQGFEHNDIWVSYKDYDDSDFVDGVRYFERPVKEARIRPAVGKNQLLKEWYATDDDWCLLMDNDAILDPRNKGDVLSHLMSGGDFSNVHCFCPINPAAPGKGAFNTHWKNPLVEDHWVFVRGEMKGSLIFLKNLRKHTGTEIYMDEGENLPSAEDYKFGFDVCLAGGRAMWCNNIVLKELAVGKTDQMLWADPNKPRSEFQSEWKECMAAMYEGMEFDGKSLKRSKFYDLNRVPKGVTIPKPNAVNSLF